MKTCYLVVVGLLLQTIATAQYNGKESAFGVRGGGSIGLTYKKFSSGNFAYEAIVAKDFDSPDDGVYATFLFQNNAPLAGRKFSGIIGAGPSYHFERKSMGVAGMLGFDWRVLSSPINFQVDWMPTYYFSAEDNKFTFINAALSVRYVLNHRKVNNREPERIQRSNDSTRTFR